jgi:hypothetical protein
MFFATGGEILGERWRHITHLTLETETMEATTQSISERAVLIEIEGVASCGFAFHALACYADGGAATCKLALTFAEQIRTTEIADDLTKHIAEASCPFAVAGRSPSSQLPSGFPEPYAYRKRLTTLLF